MKLSYFLFLLIGLVSSCSPDNPSACSCGQELSKPNAEQDPVLMNACSAKGEAMTDKQKVKWFEQVMECVE